MAVPICAVASRAPLYARRALARDTRHAHHDRIRARLSARPRRLRRDAAASALAGRRAHRGAVRAQLRGRRREQRAARRCGVRDVPLRDRRRAGVPGAAHVHGVAVRVRLARRRVAGAAAVPRARSAADGFRRRRWRCAQSGGRRCVPARRPRDREPRLALDQLPAHRRGHRARAPRARGRRDPRSSPARRPTAGTPAATARTRGASWSSTAASSTTPIRTPTTCPTGSRSTRRAARCRTSSCRTRSTPTTCASRRRRASTAATSSSRICKDAFDVLYAEGDPAGLDAPKMLSIGLHCRIAGRPARLAALARFLDYVRSHDHVWIARRIDIARHWIATHPFARRSHDACGAQRARSRRASSQRWAASSSIRRGSRSVPATLARSRASTRCTQRCCVSCDPRVAASSSR